MQSSPTLETFKQKVLNKLHSLASNTALTQEERAVMACLVNTVNTNSFITQIDIAKTERWLGCHPKHEANIVNNEFETTTRRVRQIIRDLRVKYKVPVVSNTNGYKIASSQDEAEEYLKTVERQIRAQAKSLFETRDAMLIALNIDQSSL